MSACDGCQVPLNSSQFDGDDGLKICEDCGYGVCDDCEVHGCTNSTFRKCRGESPCPCGSCQSELIRQTNPRAPHDWMGRFLPPYRNSPIGDLRMHHNLSRGSCRCEWSNFGHSYANMCASGGINCYMGGRGGKPFQGPVKPKAQLELEELLMERDLPSLPIEERICANPDCDKNGKLRCSRCRSIWYCSRDCQTFDFKRPNHGHKKQCGKHYPPSEWKYIEENERAYQKKHGHLPGEVVWDGVQSLTSLAMESLRNSGHPLVQGKVVTVDGVVRAVATGETDGN